MFKGLFQYSGLEAVYNHGFPFFNYGLSSCRCANNKEPPLIQSSDDVDDIEDRPSRPSEVRFSIIGKPDTKFLPKLQVPPTIIIHYSPLKAGWDWLILLLVVYVAVFTPYVATFLFNDAQSTESQQERSLQRSAPPTIVYFDLVVDAMFLTDMVINFRTTYMCNGEIVIEPKKIATNYLKTWFLIDAVSAIPFDFILTSLKAGAGDTVTVTGLLKTPRLLRLLRVARKIDQYSEYGASVLVLLMASFVLIAHWLACIFYAIAYAERNGLEHKISWLDWLANQTRPLNDTTTEPDLRSKYITALYFTFTILTSVGFGNVAPLTNNEKIFSIFSMMLGSLMSAAVFGNVSSIMLRLYQGTEEYHEKQASIKEFVKFHHISKPLAARLLESSQQNLWETNGIDMMNVMKSFPLSLQADISLHLNMQLLNSYSAFKGATPGCLRALSIKFNKLQAPPGDTILNQFDQIKALYFIVQGTVEITSEDILVGILGKHDVFGDSIVDALKRPRDRFDRSTFSVRSLSSVDLTTILLSDLLNVLDLYPEFGIQFLTKFKVTFNLHDQSFVRKKKPPRLGSDTPTIESTFENLVENLWPVKSSSMFSISQKFKKSRTDVELLGLSTIADVTENDSDNNYDTFDSDKEKLKEIEKNSSRSESLTLQESITMETITLPFFETTIEESTFWEDRERAMLDDDRNFEDYSAVSENSSVKSFSPSSVSTAAIRQCRDDNDDVISAAADSLQWDTADIQGSSYPTYVVVQPRQRYQTEIYSSVMDEESFSERYDSTDMIYTSHNIFCTPLELSESERPQATSPTDLDHRLADEDFHSQNSIEERLDDISRRMAIFNDDLCNTVDAILELLNCSKSQDRGY